MSTDVPEGAGPGPVGRRPRAGDGGAPASGALAIVLAIVAVVAGFLILRSINDDDDGDAGETPSGSVAPTDSGDRDHPRQCHDGCGRDDDHRAAARARSGGDRDRRQRQQRQRLGGPDVACPRRRRLHDGGADEQGGLGRPARDDRRLLRPGGAQRRSGRGLRRPVAGRRRFDRGGRRAGADRVGRDSAVPGCSCCSASTRPARRSTS